MSLKTKIKNDMWKVNYILPFVKKHQFDERGKLDFIRHIFNAYRQIRPIKGNGRHTVGKDTKAILSKVNIEINTNSQFIYFIDTKKTIAVHGNILSNFTLDYDKVIHGTFCQIAQLAVGNDNYGVEAAAVIEGVRILVERIKQAIPTSALSGDIKKKRMSDFDRMLSMPAKHFDEALQRILFFNQIMWQTRHRLNGLGRLDVILDDLYKNDIDKGILDDKGASIMVRDFLSSLSRYSEYKSDALEGDIGQIIILGGKEAKGSYFSNKLTKIFLLEQSNLGKPDPKTILRVSKNMPVELIDIAVKCLLSKTGSPLFSNDDVVIPALLDFGISENDAYNYCTSACWEPFIVGKSLDQNNIAVFDYFKAFDEIMGRTHTSFEEFVKAYITCNEKNFKDFLIGIDQVKWAKDPLVSIFTDDCSNKRQDISEGGCCYKNYGITTVALSNVVDSLFNIKKIIFDEKRFSFTELNKIRLNDYQDKEDLYIELQQLEKSYGHDRIEVIDIVNQITDSISKIAVEYKNKYDGTVKIGLSSPGYNILCKNANADISGRKKGMPYNTHISCIDAPYTEIVCFASKLSYRQQRFNGNAIDFFISPDIIYKNCSKFVAFMKGAICSGFFQMQMNIMDSKTLIDAKIHPEKYRGLIVRVWGFSAYFNDLPNSYKELLIQRAIEAENMA